MSILNFKDKDGNWVGVPSLVGPQGEQGLPGVPGEPGPNEVTGDTVTTLDGIIKGNGSTIEVATPGEDYAEGKHAPQHAQDGTDPLTPGMIGALDPADISGRTASGTTPSFDGVFDGTEMAHVTLYGKSTQDGVPSPDAPVDIVDYAPGSLDARSGIKVPYTGAVELYGIPVDEGGNYTDETGQQYIADTYDVATGEYVQRCKKLVLDGADKWSTQSDRDLTNTVSFSSGKVMTDRLIPPQGVYSYALLCNSFETLSHNAASGGVDKAGLSAHHLIAYYMNLDVRINKTALISYGLNLDNLEETKLAAWKSYLAAQYAAGTPVTVLYALAEPIVSTLSPGLVAAGPVMLYGMSGQNGTPSPENPIPIDNYVGTGHTYPLTIALPGIPVDEGGTYKDDTGQQYIADTYDVVTGEYVQRVKKLVLDGTEAWASPASWESEESISFNANLVGDRLNGNYSGYGMMCDTLPVRRELITGAGKTGNGVSSHFGEYYNMLDIIIQKGILEQYGYINGESATRVPALTAYLAAQYAAGTPVTVLYALAEPIVTHLAPQQVLAYSPMTSIGAGGGCVEAKLGPAMAPVRTTPQELTQAQMLQVLANLGLSVDMETGAVTWVPPPAEDEPSSADELTE